MTALTTSTNAQIPLADDCQDVARRARLASRVLSGVRGEVRDQGLRLLARQLRDRQSAILAANGDDVARAQDAGLTSALIDRLRLTPKRIDEMAVAVEEIARMPDPVGRIIDASVRPNGLEVRKVRVPLGVVFFIYESRPNVTTDAAALCVKSGNAVILRGGKEARQSNLAIGEVVSSALEAAGVPPDAVQMVRRPEREAVGHFLGMNQWIDIAIPRGGEELIRRVAAEATMPVMKHYKGNCHVYVDASADEAMAVAIVENAKCQRPGTCNAAETLLVHADSAFRLLPPIALALKARGVELRGCARTRALVADCKPAAEEDYDTEYLDLILAVRVVDGFDQAVEHIARHGSGHTEAIVTSDLASARRFAQVVDASAVMINASTRFNDGGQLGLGAEIGISTDKLHARGPCGLQELTTYKYVVLGEGQIRG